MGDKPVTRDDSAPVLEPFPYSDAEGLQLAGELANGSKGNRVPGVLVAPEAPGLRGPMGNNIRNRAAQLAAKGYVALGLDMYGKDIAFDDALKAHAELIGEPGKVLLRARAGLAALAAHPHVDPNRIAAIGFCQGGMTALELARANAPIRVAIGFHPGLTKPAGSSDGGAIATKILMMIGDSDPVVPEADRVAFAAEMRDRQADWQLHVFGGVGHTFTDTRADAVQVPGFGYSASADRRSWSMALSMLEEVFAED
jgi:dienelactone hydrolase